MGLVNGGLGTLVPAWRTIPGDRDLVAFDVGSQTKETKSQLEAGTHIISAIRLATAFI